jgi:hypothetical protein
MRKIFLISLISFLPLFAQTAGNSGAAFLKNGFGARNIAMGDLGVAGVNDLTALNYNPALLSGYSAPQIMLTYNKSIQDLNTQLVGASFNILGLPFALGVNNTSVSEIEVRTSATDEPIATFNAHYMFTSVSTGFNVVDNFSIGGTVKYIYENLFSDEADGFAFDLGLSYKGIVEGLEFGASLKNIGTLSELRNKATTLPTDLRIGAAYSTAAKVIETKFSFIGGVQKYLETDDSHIHIGAEAYYSNTVAIRLGYMTGYEAKGLTAGLGLYWHGINFDYAFTPYLYGLGTAHTISLMYSFN